MEHEGGSGLRTRSKAAPDWTVEESLTLANEIAAIEADCRDTLSSFQKWKIIVENCNALGVNRNLNQCRRKWDSLLSDYKKIKQSGSKKASFNSELFKAIEADCRDTLSSFQKWKIIVENCNALGVNRNLNQCRRKWDSLLSDYKKIKQSGSKKASFNSELFKAIEHYVMECEGGYDTDPEELPEPPLPAFSQSGSKNQRTKVITPQKHTVERKAKSTRHVRSESIEDEEYGSDRHTNTSLDVVEINREDHEENMAENLRKNAQLIEAIVKEQTDDDSTRINGDQIIICLSNLAVTLDELRKLQTDSMM